MFSFKTYDVTVEENRVHIVTGEKIKVTHRWVSAEQIEFLKLRYRVLRVVESKAPSIKTMANSGPLD